MTEHSGQWGSQGGYPPQGPGSYPPQQPDIRLSSLQAIRLSRDTRLSNRAPGAIRRRGPMRTSRLLRDIRLSRQGVMDLRAQQLGAPWFPGRTSQEESGNDHRDRRCGNRATWPWAASSWCSPGRRR